MPARSIWRIQLLQILREELAKYKQQAEKTRVQKLHQVSECFLLHKIPYFILMAVGRLAQCKARVHLAAAVTQFRVGACNRMKG
jgi:hypothetical protein